MQNARILLHFSRSLEIQPASTATTTSIYGCKLSLCICSLDLGKIQELQNFSVQPPMLLAVEKPLENAANLDLGNEAVFCGAMDVSRYCNHAPIDIAVVSKITQPSAYRTLNYVSLLNSLLALWSTNQEKTKQSLSQCTYGVQVEDLQIGQKSEGIPLKSTWQMQIALLYSKRRVSWALQEIASVPCISLSNQNTSVLSNRTHMSLLRIPAKGI